MSFISCYSYINYTTFIPLVIWSCNNSISCFRYSNNKCLLLICYNFTIGSLSLPSLNSCITFFILSCLFIFCCFKFILKVTLRVTYLHKRWLLHIATVSTFERNFLSVSVNIPRKCYVLANSYSFHIRYNSCNNFVIWSAT